MALFAIGDLHLSLGSNKPMDIFSGWDGYLTRLEENWRRLVQPTDHVALLGDLSWAVGLEAALEDLTFIHNLPGQKLIIKGNHDYWWSTRAKIEGFFTKHGLNTLHIINNNSVALEGLALCGTRGWLFENGQVQDRKIINREAGRLEASLASAKELPGERVALLHYPPVYADQVLPEFIAIMKKYGVRRCFYGHIHGSGIQHALNGFYQGIEFKLCSADALGFCPLRIV